MDKKQLFIWSLYDFANSLILINFVLYFAPWLVIDAGLHDFWYNGIFAVASIALLVTAPQLAAYTDRKGGRKLFLNLATIGTCLGYGLTAILALKGFNVLLVAASSLIGQYFYQLAFVFYNPMLKDVAEKEYRSRASGVGQFASSIGFAAGILITLPLSGSRLAPLLPSVLLFFIFALPLMIFFKEKKRDGTEENHVRPFKKMWQFFAVSAATPMLVAFFFFNDALITISGNYSIYLERVFNTPDRTKSLLLLLILGMSAVGGVIAGWIGDRIGALKTLRILLCIWILLIPLLALAPDFRTIVILTPFSGLLLGAVWTVTRSHLTLILPEKDMGYGFSFYTLAERFATLFGPLTWGGILLSLGNHGLIYRWAMASMTIFLVLGLLILVKWKRAAA
jgi:MFS transporter, UMF1 family